MARDKAKFKSDLKQAFKDAEHDSIIAGFNTSVDEEDSETAVAQKMATKIAETYSEKLLPKLANIIDDYLDSLEFNVSGLSNSGGTVTGILKIKP